MVKSDAQCGEHPQAEEVEFDESCIRAVFFVPLQDGSTGGCPPFHGTHVGDGAITQDYSSEWIPKCLGRL